MVQDSDHSDVERDEEEGYKDSKAYVIDGKICFKLLWLLLSWVYAIALCYILFEETSLKDVRINETQINCIFYTWVMTLIGSALIHNVLRVILVSMFVSTVVAKPRNCCKVLIDWLFVPQEAKQLILLKQLVI